MARTRFKIGDAAGGHKDAMLESNREDAKADAIDRKASADERFKTHLKGMFDADAAEEAGVTLDEAFADPEKRMKIAKVRIARGNQAARHDTGLPFATGGSGRFLKGTAMQPQQQAQQVPQMSSWVQGLQQSWADPNDAYTNNLKAFVGNFGPEALTAFEQLLMGAK